MKPRVTLIIPAYKREAAFVDTLRSVAELTYRPLEILVIDQSPEHEVATQKALQDFAKRDGVRVFTPPQITFASLTKARNFGITHAKDPEIIVFIDDDVEVRPDFIEAHVGAYENERVMGVAGRSTVPGHTYPEGNPAIIGKVTWFGSFINNYYGTAAGESDGFVGCNFSVRASVLVRTGLMEESFVGNAIREETDLAIRIREVGGIIRFVPEAYVIHHMTASGGTRSEARLQWYYSFFFNHFLFYGKHAARWRVPFFVLHLIRPIFVCWLYYGKGSPKALVTPWKGIHDGLRAAAKARQSGKAIVQHPQIRVF